jgi:hypothetical protein|tara:strand:+ start:267 stop:479 length:213 start_codon:yes stop_codon:yes gene_type:complete
MAEDTYNRAERRAQLESAGVDEDTILDILDYEFDLKLGIYPVDNLSFGDKIPKGKRGGFVRQRTKKARIF